MTLAELGRSQIEALIDEWIVGNHAQRDRQLLKMRLIDGLTYEQLADVGELSVTQVKRIIQKRTEQLYRHLT